MTEAEWENEVWWTYLDEDGIPCLPTPFGMLESGGLFCARSPTAKEYHCMLEQWLADHLPEVCE